MLKKVIDSLQDVFKVIEEYKNKSKWIPKALSLLLIFSI